MMRITRLDFERFSTLRDEWNELLETSGSTSIFLRWEWAYTWWNVFRDDHKDLYLLAAHDADGRLVGIAPCHVTSGGKPRLLPTKEIAFLGYSENHEENVCPEYLDFIAAPGERNEVVAAFFAYLLNHRTEWDVLHLTDLLETSAILENAEGLQRERGVRITQAESASCPYASLPDRWETYLEGLSSNARYSIRRKVKKLERNFKVAFSWWSDVETLDFAMHKLADLHIKRRQQQDDGHSFSTEKFNEFHRNIAREFLNCGFLRLYALELDGEIVSMLYCFTYMNRLFYYQGGFDPRYSTYSVGTALFAYAIQSAIREHITEFDFLRGHHRYKFDWTNKSRETVRLAVSRTSLAGNAYFINVFLTRRIKESLRRHLPSGAYQLLKSVRNQFISQKQKQSEEASERFDSAAGNL